MTSASLGTTKTTSGSLGTTKTTSASLETTKMTSGSLETRNMTTGTSETVKTTSESIKGMPETLGTSVGTLVTPVSALGTIQRPSGATIATPGTPRMMTVSTCTTYSPIISHIIMLCGFESGSVFVEYINQQGWSELFHVLSISVTDVNAFHTTVENNGWTYKERPLDKDLQVFKGFLLYCARMASKLKRVLEDDDIMAVITKFTFDCYLSSEAYRIDMLRSGAEMIPSVDEMARAGVFYIEQAPIVSVDDPKDKDVQALDTTTVNNGNSKDSLFVTAWIDGALDDTEEYEVLFEEEDDTAGYVIIVN